MLHSEDKEKRTERESIQPTTAAFHAPAEEKETAKSGWVCAALYLCCPRLICDSLQPWWDPMGDGSGFTNLPVSETDARLQSGGHMGWRRRGGAGVLMMMRGGLVRLLGAVGAVTRGKLLCIVELKVHTMGFFLRMLKRWKVWTMALHASSSCASRCSDHCK